MEGNTQRKRQPGSVPPVADDGATAEGELEAELVLPPSEGLEFYERNLTAAPHAGVGSPVTLWGQDASGARLSIDEIAHAAGTVGYELMCALAQRVPTRVESLKLENKRS